MTIVARNGMIMMNNEDTLSDYEESCIDHLKIDLPSSQINNIVANKAMKDLKRSLQEIKVPYLRTKTQALII